MNNGMKDDRRRSGPRSRRGSAYLVTLGVSLIVSTVALSGALAVRVQLQQSNFSDDVVQAGLNARAGLDMALYRINHDASWRSHASNWATDQTLAVGTYNFTMTDPTDGNLTDTPTDPVVVVSTGKSGSTVQKLRARLAATTPGYDCLKSAAHSGLATQWTGATVTASQWLTSNLSIAVTTSGGQNAIVTANLAAPAAATKDGSSVVSGQISTAGTWPMSMPDPNHVLDYYLTNGTWLDASSLVNWEDQLLVNPGMEGPVVLLPPTGWQSYGGCAIAASVTQVKYGVYSLLTTLRDAASDGPAQDVTNLVASGVTYNTTLYCRAVTTTDSARVSLTTVSSASGTQTVSTPWVQVKKNAWATLTGDLTPVWSGSLTSAVLRVEMKTSTQSFYVDGNDSKTTGAGSVFYEKAPQSAYAAWPRMHRAVLSPQSNPYKAIAGPAPWYGQSPSNPLNAQGIYVVDVSTVGGKLSLDRMRIVGTLVVLNGDVVVWGPVNWAPAVSNYPALLSKGNINLWMGTPTASFETLSEATANVNFNPVGTPYGGATNTTKSDTYPVTLGGIVYATGNINLQHHAVVQGVLVAGGTVTSQASTADGLGGAAGRSYVDLTYSNIFYKSAPPGFQATPVFKVVPGSVRQTMN
jgi:hypothetical protein